MFFYRISFLFLCLKLQIRCEENAEERTSVKFLLSDAKNPDFNLENFRQKKVIEEDNVAAESIILPTINLESHPYAVIVLPDLNKYKSNTFKKGRLTLDDIINGNMGRKDDEEKEEKQLDLPSDYESPASGHNNLRFPDIPIIPIIKAEGKIIDLNEQLNPVTLIPDEESETEIIDYEQEVNQTTADEDHLYSYEDLNPIEETEKEPILLSDNDRTDLVPVKNVTIVRDLKNNLEHYLSSERKTKSIDQDTSGEIISTEKSRYSGTIGSSEKYKISPASLEKKSRVTFKGFPLKFNNVLKFSQNYERQPSANVEKEIITKALDHQKQNISLPKQTLRIQAVQHLPIVSEFSELKNPSALPDKSEQQVLNSVTKNQFSTLGKARELRPVPVYENNLQDETVVKKRESTSSRSSDDKFDAITDQKQQSLYSNNTENDQAILDILNASEQKYTEMFLADQAPESELNLVPQSVSNNTFEFIRAIGTPIFSAKKHFDINASNLFTENKGSSIEQRREQINQLLKLRKQLMLLDTSSFATGKSNDDVNPENKIGSYQVKSAEIDPEASQSNINIQDKINVKPDNNLPSGIDTTAKSMLLPIKGKGGSSLTWSKFLKKSEEVNRNKLHSTPASLVTEITNISLEPYKTTSPPPQRTDIKFNPLESIKAPVIEPLHLHTRLKPNQSEEISVVFEKFDLSNAMLSSNISKYSSTNTNIDTNEQLSYNLPELSLGALSGEDSQTNHQENLEPDFSTFKRETNSDIARGQQTYSNSLQTSATDYLVNEGCIHGEEKCDEENDLQIYKVSPVIVDFASRAFNYETLVPTVVSSVSPYKHSRTITQTVQLTTVTSATLPLQNADDFQNDSNDKQEPPLEVEPRVIVSPLDNFTVTNPVHRASIKPTDVTTPLVIHNVLSLDTVTQYATVTVMTPSPIIHIHTKIVEQTRYVTITTTIPAEPLYTSTILHVMPDPKTVTVSVAAATVTSTVISPSTVTHTLYSTVCSNSDELPSDGDYGLESLLESPTNFHLRTVDYQKSFSGNSNKFNEHFWPKTAHKNSPWPAGFNTEKFEPSSEIVGSHDNHLPDLEAEESGLIMAVADPNEKPFVNRNRQRMSRSEKFENSPFMYGVPFYGFRPIDEEYPLYKSPGKGNSMKIKI